MRGARVEEAAGTVVRAGLVAAAVLMVVVALGGVGIGTAVAAAPPAEDAVEFTDVEAQSREFMGYARSIQLTPEQEAVKKAALQAIPAPCCSQYSAYTCCCECNMALTIWGLSNLLIDEHGYDAERVRAKVSEWIELINPEGFTGHACFNGGCFRPFHEDGCGGMDRGDLITG